MTVKIALESHEDTRWVAVLLSPEDKTPPSKLAKPAEPRAAEAS